MPKLQFQAPHSSSMDQLKEKVEGFVTKTKGSKEWKKDNECHFNGKMAGVSFSGVIKIFEKEVDVSLNLPLMAMAFKNQIKEEVTKELNK